MGIALPQLAPASEDRVSGAQVIDGSLRFQSVNKNYLYQTIDNGTSGFTLSLWMKPFQTGDRDEIFDTVASTGFYIYRHQDGSIRINNNSSALFTSNGLYRDSSAFYHIVFSYNSTAGYGSLYVNGRHDKSTVFATQLYAGTAKISSDASSDPAEYSLAQWYLIDGQQLGPSYFAYTDPLTNTWRPKKFKAQGTTVNDGTVWSDASMSGDGSVSNKTNAFDGSISSVTGSTGANTNLTFTFTKSIPVKNSVKVYHNQSGTIKINNETAVSTSSGGANWVTLFRGQTNFTSLTLTSTGGDTCDLRAIAVDGVILKDSTTQNLAFGTNGFYLPMDGNSPIGEDKSGKGNNWTPSGFGGSVALDNPIVSGARPILNTTAGVVARPGVFGSEVGFRDTVSSSSGGGNPYIFDTNGTRPTFNFIRGATYVFDYSSATSHPLRFATAADAAGSTEYTDGTSVSGNVISFTVPHNAPNTLYYYCTNHGGMGSSISITTDETKADPYAWKNVLALPLVGSANDVSNSVNSGSTTKAVTVTGPVTNYAFSNFYRGSYYFDGSNDELTIADSADWDIGSGDFTMEFWMYQLSITNTDTQILNQWGATGTSGVWYIRADSLTSMTAYFRDDADLNNGGATVASVSGTIKDNKWQHIAVSRNGTNLRMFVDGVLQNTTAMNFTVANATEPLRVGRQGYTSYRNGQPYNGYLSDIRFYKGVAKYTSNFVVPATSPDILPDTPSGVSGGSKLAKVTDGAVSFDGGDDDYLSLSPGADFAFGTGDFTVECYIYSNDRGVYDYIIDGRNSGQTTGTWSLGYGYASGNGRLEFASGGSTLLECPANNNPEAHKWYHVAVARSGTSLKMFIDGKEVTSATNSTDISTSPTTSYIGTRYSTENSFDGYISNVRVIKGTALYTTDFTPSTEPLTNVTNTKLLCCQSNTQPGGATIAPNLSGINNGTQWSSNFSGNPLSSSSYAYSLPNAFDGSTSTFAMIAASNGDILPTTVTLPGLTSGHSVEFYAAKNSNAGNLKFNGSVVSLTSSAGWVTAGNANGTSDNFIMNPNPGQSSSDDLKIYAVRVNGIILVDLIKANGNTFQGATNFNPFTTDIDAVRGQETDYATLNALKINSSSSILLSDGNLRVDITGNYYNALSNLGMSSGKFYCEISPVRGYSYFGIATNDVVNNTWGGDQSGNVAWVLHTNGSIYHNNATTNGTGFPTPGTSGGYTLGLLFDANSKTMRYVDNGAISKIYNMANTVDGDSFYYFIGGDAGSYEIDVNFGQKPFKFSPPAGFQPLNAASVRPETVITRPDQFFGVTTYSGSGAQKSIPLNMKPDLVWIKSHDGSTGYNHLLFDSVRGATNYIKSDSVAANQTNASTLSSFNYNGFTLGGDNEVNKVSHDYVAWSWKAGGKDGSNAFNIDDVGYASAADVGMNVGGLNGTLNKTQLWSGLFTLSSGSFDQAITNAFNGVLSSSTRARTGDNAVLITMTLSTPVTVSSEIKVIGEAGYDSTCTVTVGGITYNSSSGYVHTFNVSGSLTQMTLVGNSANGRTYFEGMEIDSKLLVDSNVSINLPSLAATSASVGTKQGFSIITYSGVGAAKTINHGLNQEPEFMMVKRTDDNASWAVYHSARGNTIVSELNGTGEASSSSVWNSINPTSKVFSIGDYADSGGNEKDYIAYLWHSVPGLQKFGKYTGNTDADGPYIELGFRPSLIIFKYSGASWTLIDDERDPINPTTRRLFADGSGNDSVGANANVDFLSNGFKIRTDHVGINRNGEVFYMAWAEAPVSNLYGAQSNAR